MKSNKEYRFETNEMEKIFHDKFKGKFENDNTTLSAIIFGWEDKYQKTAKGIASTGCLPWR